jgi:hypothetical protein
MYVIVRVYSIVGNIKIYMKCNAGKSPHFASVVIYRDINGMAWMDQNML